MITIDIKLPFIQQNMLTANAKEAANITVSFNQVPLV